MKLLIFTKTDCSYREDQKIKEIEKTFNTEGWDVAIVNVDQRDGAELAKMYDILVYPSLIMTTTDNLYINGWRDSLPSVMEIKNSLKG
jgi:pyruvate dehydrogenase complex dehydrogenase (E1) component